MRLLNTASLVVLTVLAATPAFAQGTVQEQDAGIGDIVVTAQK